MYIVTVTQDICDMFTWRELALHIINAFNDYQVEHNKAALARNFLKVLTVVVHEGSVHCILQCVSVVN